MGGFAIAGVLVGVGLGLVAAGVIAYGVAAANRAGRRKGYRGPFLLTGLAALTMATILGVVNCSLKRVATRCFM